MREIIAAGFAAHERDDAERADERECVDRRVKQRRAKAVASSSDEAEQRVAGVGDSRVGEKPADVRLRERDEIADDDGESRERGQDRRPAGDQSVPRRAALCRCETDEHDFSQHDERRHLRAGRDERGARDRRALVSVGRPEMERRGGDLEGEADERHDDAGGEERLNRDGVEFCADRSEASRAGHSVDEAQTKKRERAGGAAEKKILEARFGGTRIGFVEPGHDVKREASQLESDENHEQLFTADEKHESDRGEEKEREVFALVARGTIAPREDHREEGERETDGLEEGSERCDDVHAAEECCVRWQHNDGGHREEEAGGGGGGADSGDASARQPERKHDERGDRDDGFGRSELKEFEVVHLGSALISKTSWIPQRAGSDRVTAWDKGRPRAWRT